jgi:hypothetical protein
MNDGGIMINYVTAEPPGGGNSGLLTLFWGVAAIHHLSCKFGVSSSLLVGPLRLSLLLAEGHVIPRVELGFR